MERPLRMELEGAAYHITSRGNEQQRIFIDNPDREKFLNIFWASYSPTFIVLF